MIERTIDNSFPDMMFSYDIAGYPNKIEISVYTNELSRKLTFSYFKVKEKYHKARNHELCDIQ